MAKSSGLGNLFYIAGADLSGDVGSLDNISAPRTAVEITGINSSSIERVYTHGSGQIDFNSFFNDAAGQSHLTLRASQSAATTHVIYAVGSARGDTAALFTAKQTNYDGARGADGGQSFSVSCLGDSDVPIEWGVMLTAAKETFSSAGSKSSYDQGAATSSGAAVILQLFDINSGAPTIKIEDSANDSSWSDLVSFTAVSDGSEPTTERVTVAGAVRRYLRVTATGTLSNAVVAVAIRIGTANDSVAYA
jgi:hypothetical protein